jgi:hypothetical protein
MSEEFEYEKSAREHAKLARSGDLPAGFNQWGLAHQGEAVAHAAAVYGYLPDDFDQWELLNINGWTVAHVAAAYKHLPANFSRWGLVSNDGQTVLSYFLLASPETRWERKPLCKTDADWEVFKRELPEIHQKYTIGECMLDADDQGALRGALL